MPRTRFVWQLFAGWCALVAVVLSACFWISSVQLARLADDSQLRRMADAAVGLADLLPPDPAAITDESFTAAAGEIARTAGVRFDLLAVDGTLLRAAPAAASEGSGQGWQAATAALLEAARAGGVARDSRYDAATGRRVHTVAVPLGPAGAPAGIVQVTADTAAADRELAVAQRRLLGGYLVAALAALAGGLVLARRAARPVGDLSESAARLAAGEFDAPLPVPEAAELAKLACALAGLREQLVERGLTIGRQGTQQEAVLGSMLEGVLAIDARQRIVSINRGAAELLGLDPARVLRRPLQEVVRNPDLRRFALLAIDCREPVEDDLVIRGVDDRTIRLRGTALRDVSGEGGAVIVLNDVTEIQRLENVRRDFVANVSHELKTPIASIKGFLETLLDGAADDPVDNRRFLGIVARQAERLEAIIEDLLALSRIEQSEGAGNLPLDRVHVISVLSAAVAGCQLRARERGVAIEVACDGTLESDLNPALLEQAVINLVDNAVKYSEPGSTVWVEAAEEPAADGPAVRIRVRDQGCGIDAEHLPRIFERFYRVDRARSRQLGGTGLGLSIVKHIVQAHGGAVAVDSTPGTGSTFTIHLPTAVPA
ncbi:MAG: HAMP domain-containing protein [Planctomycetia bacterium]|nr:HAMP domain-containing protein [Planctomycetia bacterium]